MPFLQFKIISDLGCESYAMRLPVARIPVRLSRKICPSAIFDKIEEVSYEGSDTKRALFRSHFFKGNGQEPVSVNRWTKLFRNSFKMERILSRSCDMQ
jgi:hypothetical protein